VKIGDYFFTGVYHDSQFYWRENRGETTYLVASYLTTLTPKVILSTPPHEQDPKPNVMRDTDYRKMGGEVVVVIVW
jgi:hypothetical protein